jgi:hypothetical protein
MEILFYAALCANSFEWGNRKIAKKYGYSVREASTAAHIMGSIHSHFKFYYEIDITHDFNGKKLTSNISKFVSNGVVNLLPEIPGFAHLKDFVNSTHYIFSHEQFIYSKHVIEAMLLNSESELVYCPIRIYLLDDFQHGIPAKMWNTLEYSDDFSILYPPDVVSTIIPSLKDFSEKETSLFYTQMGNTPIQCNIDDLPSIFVYKPSSCLFVKKEIKETLEKTELLGINWNFLPVFKGFSIDNQLHRREIGETEEEFIQRSYELTVKNSLVI